MATLQPAEARRGMGSTLIRVIGLTIGFIWAGFWTWYGATSAIGDGMGPIRMLLHASVPGLIFLACVIIACFRPGIGGVILMLMGAVTGVGMPLMSARSTAPNVVVLVLLTMALPPIVAGAMLMVKPQLRKQQ
jgi:hypothetical protein